MEAINESLLGRVIFSKLVLAKALIFIASSSESLLNLIVVNLELPANALSPINFIFLENSTFSRLVKFINDSEPIESTIYSVFLNLTFSGILITLLWATILLESSKKARL